jgi:hypothetical protein
VGHGSDDNSAGHDPDGVDPNGGLDPERPGYDPSRPEVDVDERMARLRHDLAVANDDQYSWNDLPGLDDV